MVLHATTFGKYVLLKRIAVGGMAEVFRAKAFGAKGFTKSTAVKRMLPHLSSDSQFVDMFINEANLAANCNHTGIVQIHDFGRLNDQYFIAMEYVHGKNTAEIIRKLRDMELTAPLDLACHIFIEVLNALDYAHRLRDPSGKPLNLIHRDMSPRNIMVSYEGEVKIADFGIAKAASTTIETSHGKIKGKHKYLSPEQVQRKKLDHRTDIFSLGICFYQMLTLAEMYTAASISELMKKVRDAAFIMPRELNPNIPEKLEVILLKALKKEPDERYASAAEWRETLAGFLDENGLRPSASRLSDFMHDIFKKEIEQEQEELALEDKVTERLRPEEHSISRSYLEKPPEEPEDDFGGATMQVGISRPGVDEAREADGNLDEPEDDFGGTTVREVISRPGPDEAVQIDSSETDDGPVDLEEATDESDREAVAENPPTHPSEGLPGADFTNDIPPTIVVRRRRSRVDQPGATPGETFRRMVSYAEMLLARCRKLPPRFLLAALLGFSLACVLISMLVLYFAFNRTESDAEQSPGTQPSADAGITEPALPAGAAKGGQEGSPATEKEGDEKPEHAQESIKKTTQHRRAAQRKKKRSPKKTYIFRKKTNHRDGKKRAYPVKTGPWKPRKRQ